MRNHVHVEYEHIPAFSYERFQAQLRRNKCLKWSLIIHKKLMHYTN